MTREQISKLVRYLNQIDIDRCYYSHTPKDLPDRGSKAVFVQIVRKSLTQRTTPEGERSWYLSDIPTYLSLKEARAKLASKIGTMTAVMAAAEALLEDSEEGI